MSKKMEKASKDVELEVPTKRKRGRPCGPAGAGTFYQIDTKGMCLICLRDRHCSNKRGASALFCTVLLRYLKLDFHRNVVKPSNFKWKPSRMRKVGIELCQDCSLLAGSFKEMYCQMELIQMRMDACIKTISNIMRTAGRIPSRVKAYQQRLGIIPKEDPGDGIKPALCTPKAAVLSQNFRKELIQKTVERNRVSLPRVVLTDSSQRLFEENIGPVFKLSNGDPKGSTKPLSSIQIQLKNFLLGYAFSFATILLLTTLGRDQIVPVENVAHVHSSDNVATISAIEDVHSSECSTRSIASTPEKVPEEETASKKQQEIGSMQKETRKNSITITDSGKTVLLPHQSFKTDAEFVDESIMEYEETADLIDISDDGFFAQANSFLNDVNITEGDNLVQPETVKQEPQESVIEVNDRFCKECRIHLSCRAELEKHRSLIHKWENHVQCPVCKNMFSSYHFLKMHRKDSESCSLDEAKEALEFATIAKPLFPFSSTVRGNRFCPMEGCFEVFLKSETLQLHLKAHGLFSCSHATCKETFDKAHDLALHECQQHSTGSQFSGYKCTRCNFHVGGQYQYILHFLGEHLKINIFSDQCSICRKGFITKGSAISIKEVHFRTHHDVKGKDPKSIVNCDVDDCKAFFLKKQQLRVHKTHIHHIEQDAKMNCSICGEKMLNQFVMMKHKLQAHSNLQGHEIEVEMKRKLSRTIKKGKYDCMYCGNQYSSKYSLLIHSKVHDHLKNAALEEEERKRKEAEKESRDADSTVQMETECSTVDSSQTEENTAGEVIDLC